MTHGYERKFTSALCRRPLPSAIIIIIISSVIIIKNKYRFLLVSTSTGILLDREHYTYRRESQEKNGRVQACGMGLCQHGAIW